MENKKLSCVKAPASAVIHRVPRKDITCSTSVSSGAAKTVLQPDSFIHENLFLHFQQLVGIKTFSLTIAFLPSLIFLNRLLFLTWHCAPCSDWCRKTSPIRHRFANIWREELTDLRQGLLGMFFHRLFEISACYLLFAVANSFPPSFVKYSGTQIVLYEPDSFFILRASQ